MITSRPRTRAVAATVLAAAIGLLAPACSGGSSSPGAVAKVDDKAATVDQTTTSDPTQAQGSDPASPGDPTETTTTAAPPATTGLEDQEAVALRLYDAWFANDKVTAATVADQAAIDAMWLTAPGDYSLYNQCSTGEFDTSGCLFRGNNGTIQIDLEKRGDLWVVSGVFYSAP